MGAIYMYVECAYRCYEDVYWVCICVLYTCILSAYMGTICIYIECVYDHYIELYWLCIWVIYTCVLMVYSIWVQYTCILMVNMGAIYMYIDDI